MNNIIKLGTIVPQITCGLCGKIIKPTILKEPLPINNFDKNNNIKRDHSFNCCGYSWLLCNKVDGSIIENQGKELY